MDHSVSSRNYGIDALRIFSMWLVVILHILGWGGVISHLVPFSAKYEVVRLLETLAYCAVNCYALISGYVGLNSKFKLSRLFYLWLQVAFYSILITLAFNVMKADAVGAIDYIKSIFPVMSDQYWYFTAYFALFFFSPILNYLILSLPKQNAVQFLLALFVLFSVIPTLRHADVFYTKYGYSVTWLATLYLFGAYLKKYGVKSFPAGKLIAAYLLFTVVSWSVRLPIEILTNWKYGEPHMGHYLTEYTSPTILGSSIALFMYFCELRINSLFLQRAISRLAPLSFGIYLIHTHPLIWDNVIFNGFVSISDKRLIICVIIILVAAGGIVIGCMGIDALRRRVFDLFRVREKCESLQQILENRWERIFFKD